MSFSAPKSMSESEILQILQNQIRLSGDENTFQALPQDHTLEQIASEAQRQGVAPWIYEQIKNHYASLHGASKLLQLLRPYRLLTEARNLQNQHIFYQLQSLLGESGISITPLKGLALVLDHYPSPGLRPIGDIDVYIAPNQIYQARDLLLQNGAKHVAPPLSALHEEVHAHVRALLWNGQMIELHQRLYDLGNPLHLNQSIDQWKIAGAKHNQLKTELLCYHLISHLYYNLKLNGARLGWLLDIAMVFSNHTNPTLLLKKTLHCNPPAEKILLETIGFCLPLMTKSAAEELQQSFRLKPAILKADKFRPSPHSTTNHKKQVLQQIAQIPGFSNKCKLLWKEFFPDTEYMQHFYPVSGKLSLMKFYAKRILGLRK